MSEASREMVKQLELYADAITAFATAQLLTFIYLMAQGSCFTKNVLNHISVPIVLGILVNAAYFALVYSCHRAEDRIVAATEPREDVIQGIVKNLRRTRYIILIVDCVMTVGVLGLIDLGVYFSEFHFDCKG
ncbi:MAG: hypothetical protein WAN10_14580 [Candidatus Acidiferrales bacterium]